MKTKSEQKIQRNPQSGNALIYVLIAIALFAALSFTLARQNRNETTSQVDDAREENYALQLISYTAQVKSVIDQMMITGTQTSDLIFTLPGESGFNTPPDMHKIYHPSGGGLAPYNLPAEIITPDLTPVAGVYLGVFNNTEWTPTSAHDIMLAAYGITRGTCETLNQHITGSKTIPTVTGNLEQFFIDASHHTSNQDFEISTCADCENKLTLCVSDSSGTKFVYYTIIDPR